MNAPEIGNLPPPTCNASVTYRGIETASRIGADVVVDVTGDLVHLIVPMVTGGMATVRLTFAPLQLASLLDDLVEASELVTS